MHWGFSMRRVFRVAYCSRRCSLAAPAAAQIQSRPTDAPIVTADNESWYVNREPIQFAGDLILSRLVLRCSSTATRWFAPVTTTVSRCIPTLPSNLTASSTFRSSAALMQPHERPATGKSCRHDRESRAIVRP